MVTQDIFSAIAEFLPPSNNATIANASLPEQQSHLLHLSINTLPSILFSLLHKNQDFLKLMIIGGVIETFRRFYSQSWAWIYDSFFITAHFDSTDDSFSWIIVWLSKQKVWERAREVNISTDTWGQTFNKGVEIPNAVGESDDEGFLSKRKLVYLPSYETTHWLWYKGTWVSVVRSKASSKDPWSRKYDETLSICLFTRNYSVLRSLLRDAKSGYKDHDEDNVEIYAVDSMGDWSLISTRRKRPLSSIVLEPEIKKTIMDDTKEFLSTEKWYIDRGIPYRRGYLLHGVPGSGKTSLIHSIAGELGLDIYIMSLAKKGLDDSKLNELISSLPSRSIVLMEDIDAAFLHSTSRAVTQTPDPTVPGMANNPQKQEDDSSKGVTLSGLLSALDGVAAQEGRILFATTNRYHALDEALCRPGRMDLHIEFKNATKWQASELFRKFYPQGEAVDKMVQEGEEKMRVELTQKDLDELAERFADAVPADQLSMASLQGHLMRFKERPYEAVAATPAWVAQEALKRASVAKVT